MQNVQAGPPWYNMFAHHPRSCWWRSVASSVGPPGCITLHYPYLVMLAQHSKNLFSGVYSTSKLTPISRPTIHHSSCCQSERMVADLEKVVLVEATACRRGSSLSLHSSNLVFLSAARSYLQRSSIPLAFTQTQTERHRCRCPATAFLPCQRCQPYPFSPREGFASGWHATIHR
jgi:hypothetical protein